MPAATRVWTNSDRVFYGDRVLQSLTYYDILSGGQGALLTLIPFLLARRVFATPDAQRVLLMALANKFGSLNATSV